MFIGIQGYTLANDKYDVLLPAVNSWTLDKRKKASKKNNFAGGFSSSSNKNDEYRFYSISWDELPENDLAEAEGKQDFYSAISRFTSAVTLTTGAKTVYVLPYDQDIQTTTPMWVKRSNGTFVQVTLAAPYVAGTNTMSLTYNGTLVCGITDMIVLHKTRGVGLLSLASLAATGSTHLLRDFMGNLVKVILQSPKYNALAGTDEYSQMYFDVKLDFDLVTDTASRNFMATKGLNVNVSNDSLPKLSTVATSTGAYDLSSFFVREGNTFNVIRHDLFTSGTSYQLFTSSAIAPHMPIGSNGGMPLLSLSRKIGVFKNFISTGNQLNLKFVGKNNQTVRDDVPGQHDLEITLDCPEIIYGGAYNPTIEYGAWADYSADATYNAGTYVKQGGNLYCCLLDQTKGVALTDTKSWYLVPVNTPIVVSLEGKFYKLLAATAKDKSPKTETTIWGLYTIEISNFFVKCSTTFASKLEVTDSLIIIIQPFAFQDANKTVNKSSVLLRVPIVNGPILQDLDIIDQAEVLKLAALYPVEDKALSSSYIGNNVSLTGLTDFKYYQNGQLGSSVLALPINTTGNKVWSSTASAYYTRYNIEQCTRKLVNYTVVNIRNPTTTAFTISDGLTKLVMNGNKSSSQVTFRVAKSQAPISIGGTISLTPSSNNTLVQSFNVISLDKILIETILTPSTTTSYTITQNIYWVTLDSNFPNGIKVVKDEPSKSGLSLTRNKLTGSAVFTQAADTNVVDMMFSQPSSTQYVDLASSITYAMEPVGDAYIAKFFGLDELKWV